MTVFSDKRKYTKYTINFEERDLLHLITNDDGKRTASGSTPKVILVFVLLKLGGFRDDASIIELGKTENDPLGIVSYTDPCSVTNEDTYLL